jgi:hypothetical protein
VVFLDMLRYVDSLQIFKIRHGMRKQIKARMRATRRAEDQQELAFMEDLLQENPEADLEQDRIVAGVAVSADMAVDAGSSVSADMGADMGAGPGVGPGVGAPPLPERRRPDVVDLHQEFRHRFPWYIRFRSFLLRHRIRTHLISGIEFQMAVFIVAPAVDAIAPVTMGAGALLLVFELAVIYKLLLSTRDFTRTIQSFGTSTTV